MNNVAVRKISHRSVSLPAHLNEADKKKKKQWDLVTLDSLPHFLNDNQYLLKYHRPELNSFSECFKSIFMMHTETLNVWTHFLGATATTGLYCYHITNSPSHWLQTLYFSLFFFGAITCMTVSAIYHTLICHSEPVFKLFAKLDYCGVILLITTSYFLWMHFGFYCSVGLKTFYIILVFLLSSLSIGVVIQDRFCDPRHGLLRAGLFITLGLTSVVPGIHFIIIEHFSGFPSASISWLVIMGMFYLTGGLAYASKIPERIWPGMFDIWFQSHQILHLAVVAGVLLCYKGASILAAERNKQTCSQ